jgi:hypothetical protein
VILITSGNYSPSSEYPTIKQLSFGPPMDVKKLPNMTKIIHKEFDFTRFAFMYELGLKSYNDTFLKYKNAAIDHNVDLFLCHGMMNDPCLDAGHALNKPVVGFLSYLNGNYI